MRKGPHTEFRFGFRGMRRRVFIHIHMTHIYSSKEVWKSNFRQYGEMKKQSKSARRCGAKHISKSKCTKYTSSGPLLEVEMSKKCTPLWREAHFEVKMYKTHQLRTTFGSWDVEKVHAAVARSTFRSQNVQNTTCSRHFWRFRCWNSVRRCGAKHPSKSHYITIHYTPVHSTTLNYTTPHYITLNDTATQIDR